MNKKDRDQILRVYDLLQAIPFPDMGGSKTATVKGYVDFAIDMREARGFFNSALLALLVGEHWDGIAPGKFDDMVKAGEVWVARRKVEGWCIPTEVPSPLTLLREIQGSES